MGKRYYWETENSRHGGAFNAASDQQAKEMMLKIMKDRPGDTLLCLYHEGNSAIDMVEIYQTEDGWSI
jgi:hypothetical protein